MDYRGFGDSTGEPTESGLLTDALYLYHWVKTRSKDSLLILWGHSIGTVVTTSTAVKLQEQGNPADALILEGAFTDVICKKAGPPFAWFYWKFPYIQYFFLGPLKESKTTTSNEDNLKKIKTPLLMLHAEDDQMAPIQMAHQLYSIAKGALNSNERVKLVSFDRSLGYRHNGLYRDPEVSGIIRDFVQSLKA